MADQELWLTVVDTDSFQNFQWFEVGTLEVPQAGQMELVVTPQTKVGNAVKNLRQIRRQRINQK